MGVGSKILGCLICRPNSLKSCINLSAPFNPWLHETILQQNREFKAAFPTILRDTAPQKPPFLGFSSFCQSLALNDVTAIADTRACYTSLKRTQRIKQVNTNKIFNFAPLDPLNSAP